jgi:hypothetical protein
MASLVIPGVQINISQFNLGTVAPNGSQVPLIMGTCSGGTPGVLQSFASLNALQAALGQGRLVTQAANCLSIAGGPVLCMPLPNTNAGLVSSVTATATTGDGYFVVSQAPTGTIGILVASTGTLSTATLQYQVSGDGYSAPVPIASSFRVPGTMTTITFGAGTYTAGTSVNIALDGTLVNGTSNTVSVSHSVVNDFDVLVDIVTSGATGVGQFTISLDGGNTVSAPLTINTGSKSIVQVPNAGNAGLALTWFASSNGFVAGDSGSFITRSATASNSDITAALQALGTTFLTSNYFSVQVCDPVDSISAAITRAAVVDTQMDALQTKEKFVAALIECPTLGSYVSVSGSLVLDTADTDAALITAKAAASLDYRIALCAGNSNSVDSTNGLILQVNAASPIMARLAEFNAATQASKVANGPIVGVVSISRDEAQLQDLDPVGYCTLRSFVGLTGFYVTGVHSAAVNTSDFYRFANVRVMNEACGIAYINALQYLNDNIPVNANDGTILESAAQKIENNITNALVSGLVSSSPQDAVDATCTVDRTNNLLSTATLQLEISVRPFGYADFIVINIGFTQ